MAGMDWFRWHHGSVTDPKFQLVARKTKSRVADVIAVWAFILETASQSDDRGCHGDLDFESIDCALGLDDGQTAAIHAAMIDRTMLDADGHVTAWDKRQPKREREDDNSTERSKALRLRKRQLEPCDTVPRQIPPFEADFDDATPCNAMQRQKTPRVEESRVDKRNTGGEGVREAASPPAPPSAIASPPPIFSTENQKFIATERPDLDGPTVWANFCDHYPGEKRNDAAWRKWVRREMRGPVAGVDLAAAPATSDPDSRASVETAGLALGIGRWDQLTEPWSAYKTRVKAAIHPAIKTATGVIA